MFSGSRTISATLFRNLHTPADRARNQSSDLWERATGPLVGPAKPQGMRLTWRGSRAPDRALIARSSEQSCGLCFPSAKKG